MSTWRPGGVKNFYFGGQQGGGGRIFERQLGSCREERESRGGGRELR
jgi:hypothetical protein